MLLLNLHLNYANTFIQTNVKRNEEERKIYVSVHISKKKKNASEFLMMILNQIDCVVRIDMNFVSIFNDASQQHSPLKFSVCKLESFAVSAVA